MSSNIDLRQLAVRRGDASSPAKVHRRRHVGTRVLLPCVIGAGFLAVLGWAARDSFLPSRPVTVVPVVTTYAQVQSEGAPVCQAAGWIEPRPTPILVTALAEGVVDKLLVVEGQKLKAGDQVAQLIREDALLGLQAAESDLDLRQAEVARARAALGVAQGLLPFQLKAARARLELAQETFEARKQTVARGASPLLSLPSAKSELDMAASAVADLEIRERGLKAQGLGPFAEAEADVKTALARQRQAEVAVATARLRLERMVIKAPVHGQVITLVAKPGQKLMGQSAIGHSEASTVITMFDPTMIQVRADVRLEDVPKVQPGQRVKIETPVTADPLDGEVLQITSQADIQKNTLQVKVAVTSPPPTLLPDMLVQATFLAPAAPKGADDSKQTLRLMIPRQLVESAEGRTHVWTADLANKRARKKAVQLGRASGEFVEVTQGLNASDRLIVDGRQGLSDGERVAVTHVDAGLDEPTHHDKGARPNRLPNAASDKDHSAKH